MVRRIPELLIRGLAATARLVQSTWERRMWFKDFAQVPSNSSLIPLLILFNPSLSGTLPQPPRNFLPSKGTPLWLQLQKGTIFHLEVGNRHPVPVDRSRGIPNSYWKTDYVFSINTNTDNNSNNNNDILIIDICISRMIILPAPHHLTPPLLGVNPCRATNDDGIQPALRCFHPCAKTPWPAPRLNVGRRSQVEIMWT